MISSVELKKEESIPLDGMDSNFSGRNGFFMASPTYECKRVWEYLFPLQVFNRELEFEYDTFEDWLHTFNLYRGKCSDDADVEQNAADEDRLIGKFKVCRHSSPIVRVEIQVT